MGLKEYRQRQKESRAFKGIVAKRTLAEKRRAYEKEAFKVAAEQGAARARRPSFGEQVAGFAKKAAAPRKPLPAVRRAPVRRRLPLKRRLPARRRVIYRGEPLLQEFNLNSRNLLTLVI